MEKGKINSLSSNCGTIMDDQGRSINFDYSSQVGRDKSSLIMGDAVWFERIGSNASVTAINIRRC